MPTGLELVASNIGQSLTQLITGKLLTDSQIRSISANVVGRYFTQWLATPKDEKQLDDRISEAKDHLTRATAVILELKGNLESQVSQLESASAELKTKREEAARYAVLAKLGSESVAATREELRATVRAELEAQSKQGRWWRQSVAFIVWLLTLVLGSYLPQIVEWSRTHMPHREASVQRRAVPAAATPTPATSSTARDTTSTVAK